MVTVTRDGLARLVADRHGNTRAEAARAIEAILEVIRERAEAGDTVRTPIGSFSVRARPARTGRNPATGQPIDIPETRRLVFKAAKKTVA